MLQPVHWTLLMTLLVSISTAATNTIVSPFLHWAGFSLPMIGFVVSLRGVASLISRVPGGLLYRPATVRAASVGSCLLLAVSTGAYIFTHDPTWVITMRVLQGVTWGVASTLNLALFYDTVPDGAVRGRLIATQGLFEVIGQSVGNFAGGWLLDWFGFAAAFTLAVTSAATASICPLGLPRSVARPTRSRPEKSGGKAGTPRRSWKERLAIATHPLVLVIGTSYMTHRFIFQFLNAYFPLWALQSGLSYAFIGTFRGMQSLAGLVGRPVAGEATRLFRANQLMIGGLVLSALSVMVIPTTTSTVLLLGLAAAGSLTRSATQVAMRLQLYEGTESAPEIRGVASGLFMAGGDLGIILGPLAGGFLAGAWGLTASLWMAPALSALPLLLALLMMRRQRRLA